MKNNQFHNEVEMVELLIYGINPFSKNTERYFNNLYNMRKKGVKDSLEVAAKKFPNVKFLEKEYNDFFLRKATPYCMLYQHWRIFQYVNLKARITQIAKKQNRNPEELYNEIMPILKRQGTNVHGGFWDNYLKEHNIQNETDTYLKEAYEMMQDIGPKYNGPNLWAPYESSFESIVNLAKSEKAVLGFAHPGFTIQNMTKETAIENIKTMVEKSQGRLIYSENYHQAYPPQNITPKEIDETNKIMDNIGLIPIGGRDMHRSNFKF